MTDVDAALTPDGRLHILWGAFDERGNGHDACWYARSDSGDAGWSPPSVVDSTTHNARLAVAGSRLHAFVPGERLRHLVAGAVPGSWTEEAPIGLAHQRPGAFDVVGNDSEIVVAYVTWSSPDSEAGPWEGTTKLVVAEIRAGGGVAYHDVAQFGHRAESEIRGPRIVRFRNELHVVIGVSVTDTLRQRPRSRAYGGAGVGADTVWWVGRSRILDAYRASMGGPWSDARDIFPAREGQSSRTLALSATDDHFFVFYMGEGLEGLESTDGRHWAGPVHITDAHYDSDPRALAASAYGGDVVVAWIDERLAWGQYLPNLGNTPEAESDVFAIRSTARPVSLASLARSPIVRVTPSGRFMCAVAAVAAASRQELAWVTYERRWGRRPLDPEVGVARLPAAVSR